VKPPLEYPGIASLVGVPWVYGGRDRNGVDCYGIIKLALAEIGEELPDLPKSLASLIMYERARATLITPPPDNINPWDIVVLYDNMIRLPPEVQKDNTELAKILAIPNVDIVSHGALVVDNGRNVLESDHRLGGVVIARLNRASVRSVVRLKRFQIQSWPT
jgi:cell wall-associated NlpC family hydrolase